MRYDLLVQSPDPKVPYDDTELLKLLDQRGATATPDGRRVWRLKHGEVTVKPLKEGGQLIGTEVSVPLSEKLELIREAVVEAATLASEAKLRLFDPQLARQLTAADDTAVADQYLRTAKYAGGMLGVSDAIGAAYEPPKSGFSVSTKLILIVAGAFLVLYFVMNSLMSSLRGE